MQGRCHCRRCRHRAGWPLSSPRPPAARTPADSPGTGDLPRLDGHRSGRQRILRTRCRVASFVGAPAPPWACRQASASSPSTWAPLGAERRRSSGAPAAPPCPRPPSVLLPATGLVAPKHRGNRAAGGPRKRSPPGLGGSQSHRRLRLRRRRRFRQRSAASGSAIANVTAPCPRRPFRGWTLWAAGQRASQVPRLEPCQRRPRQVGSMGRRPCGEPPYPLHRRRRSGHPGGKGAHLRPASGGGPSTLQPPEGRGRIWRAVRRTCAQDRRERQPGVACWQ